MDWLLNVLKYAPNSNGSDGSSSPWPTSTAPVPFVNSSGQPSPTPAAPAPAGNPQQMPGLWGSLMNRFQPGNPQQGNQQNAGNQFLMNQAMSLMKGPQFQPTQWMPWMGR